MTENTIKNMQNISLDDEEVEIKENKKLILVSSEKKEFKIDYNAAQLSQMINNAIKFNKECSKKANIDCEEIEKIEISHVSSDLVPHIVEYMEWHYSNPDKITNIPIPMYCYKWEIYVEQKKLQQWDFDFINRLDGENIIRLAEAADYLGIDSLYTLACAKVAQVAKTFFSDEDDEDPYKAGRKFADWIGNTWWDEKQAMLEEEQFEAEEKEREKKEKQEIEEKRRKLEEKKKNDKNYDIEINDESDDTSDDD